LLCLTGAAFAQSSQDPTIISLSVEKGFPLQVALTAKLDLKMHEPVHGVLVEPVYSFDREVIPSGSKLEGTITALKKPGKWKRISAMLGGDFTSHREPEITFHTLVLPNGSRLPIQTEVGPGANRVVGSDDKSQPSGDSRNGLIATTKTPAKERLKNLLWGMAPFHPQYLASGTRLSAELVEPLDFGEAVLGQEALAALGVVPPADSIVSVRLITPLDSRTAIPGTPIQALLTRPLFSSDRRLIFPVGTKVEGKVTAVKHARSFHRNGQLALTLTTIEPPDSLISAAIHAQNISGSVVDLQVGHDMKNLRIKDGDTAKFVESKKRFVGPAWAFISAARSVSADEYSFGSAVLGAYRNKFLKQVTGGESRFGLPAGISGAMFPPVGMGFAFFGAARSAYSNFLGRGREISVPANTLMEIRLDKADPVRSEKEN
jgi:hypothetical protein